MTPFERGCTTPEARACYTRIEKRIRAEGAWRDEFALGLAPTAAWCSDYLRDARALRTLTLTAEARRLHENILKSSRKLCLEALRPWVDVLEPPQVNADGEDATIAALCAPLPRLIDP